MTTSPYTIVLHRSKDHQYFGLYVCEDVPSGVYVATIEPHSPAAKANIQPGDHVLAINGQYLSPITRNPQAMIIQIANYSDTITLLIQPSNILQFLGLTSHTNQNDQVYSPGINNGIDQDLAQFLKSVLNQNVHINPSLSSNPNEYILTSQDDFSAITGRQRRRHHRSKPRSFRSIETQTSVINEPKNNPNTQTLPMQNIEPIEVPNETPPNRTVTSVQSNPPVFTNSAIALPPPSYANRSVEQPNFPDIRRLSSESDHRDQTTFAPNNGLREVTIRRRPNYQGYGFHIQYNRHFFLILRVEAHSPAENAGLHNNDVILKVNNQSTNKMMHKIFVQILENSSEVVFLVQDYDSYMRANPGLLQKINARPPTPPPTPANPNPPKAQHGISKALQKLTSR